MYNLYNLSLYIPLINWKKTWCDHKLLKFIPTWYLHSASNRFLDTDVWVHDQERALRGVSNSFLPNGQSQFINQNNELLFNLDMEGKSRDVSDESPRVDSVKPLRSLRPILPSYVLVSQSDTGIDLIVLINVMNHT